MKFNELVKAISHIGALVPNAVTVAPHEFFTDWLDNFTPGTREEIDGQVNTQGAAFAMSVVACAKTFATLGYVVFRVDGATNVFYASILPEAKTMFPEAAKHI
jgi:hypothetical protein